MYLHVLAQGGDLDKEKMGGFGTVAYSQQEAAETD
jgi:hypothetical protein